MADSPSELQVEVEKLERKHAENPEGRYFVPLANAFRKQGDLEHAEALLREGLRKHPDYLSAHIVLGRCLADRGANAEAAEEFRFVLSMDPQNLIALRTLGDLAAAEGRPQEAQRWFRELLAVDPMNDEARRALESLDAPAADEEPADAESDEEIAARFEATTAWWEPPADEDEQGQDEPEAGAAETPPGADVEEVTASAGAAAAADPPADGDDWLTQVADSWEAPEPEGEPEQSAEPAPAAEPEPVVEPQRVAEPASAAPDDDGPLDAEQLADAPVTEMVVTETIAELYARQGLHDRAAEVYRELIRRRGGDAVLEARLAELEGGSSGDRPAPEPVPESHPEPEPSPEPQPEPEPAAEWPLDESTDVPFEADDEDAFAASFADGFGDPAAEPGADELLEDGSPQASAPVGAEVLTTVGSEPGRISDFLAAVAGWRPGAPGAGDAPAEQLPGEPAPGYESEPAPASAGEAEDAPPMGEPLPLAAWEDDEPAMAEPLGVEDLLLDDEPVRADGTVPAADEPFPWELPEPSAGGAGEAAAPAGTGALEGEPVAYSAAEEEPFDIDGLFGEPDSAAQAGGQVAPEPEPSVPGSPAPEPGAEAEQPAAPQPTTEEDADDLESFQAWLRSLKR